MAEAASFRRRDDDHSAIGAEPIHRPRRDDHGRQRRVGHPQRRWRRLLWIVLEGGSSVVQNLVINGFGGDGVAFVSRERQPIVGQLRRHRRIGRDLCAEHSRRHGCAGGSNNTIGGNTAANRNIISGNSGDGIAIEESGSTGNVVEGNYIGTDVSGLTALPNGTPGVMVGSRVGVLIANGATGNTVGGPMAGGQRRLW